MPLTRGRKAAQGVRPSPVQNPETVVTTDSANPRINTSESSPGNAMPTNSASASNLTIGNLAASVSSGPGGGSWNNNSGLPENSMQVYAPFNSLTSLAGTPDPTKISKIVRDIIPSFDGKNMSVKMFTEHCRAAISMISPLEMPYLTMLIRTKIIGEARLHIQDHAGIKLGEMLKTLELIYSTLEDPSQLLQNLAHIKRKPVETIPEYGARVNQILNKIITQTLEDTLMEKAIGICEAYRITTIGNFLRGLDKDVYSQIKDKEKF